MFEIKIDSFINLNNIATVDFRDKDSFVTIGYNCCDDTGELAFENVRFKTKEEYQKAKRTLRTKLVSM